MRDGLDFARVSRGCRLPSHINSPFLCCDETFGFLEQHSLQRPLNPGQCEESKVMCTVLPMDLKGMPSCSWLQCR